MLALVNIFFLFLTHDWNVTGIYELYHSVGGDMNLVKGN